MGIDKIYNTRTLLQEVTVDTLYWIALQFYHRAAHTSGLIQTVRIVRTTSQS